LADAAQIPLDARELKRHFVPPGRLTAGHIFYSQRPRQVLLPKEILEGRRRTETH
jgi:hypothetical protein